MRHLLHIPLLLVLVFPLALLVECNPNIGGVGSDDGGTDLGVVLPDAGPVPGCGLRTCASADAHCGPIGDGCGGLLDCGKCVAPKTCGGGGKLSFCGGSMGCVARTCKSLGANCGPAADGCGNLLDCGTCTAGSACGIGGKPNVCAPILGGGDGGGVACMPKSCMQLGYNCGPAGDGCGGLLNCGSCPAGQSCGDGGKPSVCGTTNSCTPRSCKDDGYTCGMSGDGCGGIINCGTCTLPDICGGGGRPNVCGNTPMPDGGVPPVCDGGTTSISGTVLAPTNPALGYGQPDPIYNALVYVPSSPVLPFPTGVSCDKCSAEASGNPIVSVVTGPDGKFSLKDTPCGRDIPLVIQVGRWRRQIIIPAVTCCANNPLTGEQTRLPRNHTEGDIPLFAVVTGSADPIECVLPKIGIDASEYSQPSGTGRVRFYIANGANYGLFTPGANMLWSSPTELAKYDAIIADCEGSPIDKSTAWKTNVLNYTNAGGRLFASHYSYTWLYNIAPFKTTAAWDVDQMQPPNLTAFIDQSFPKGMAFAQWLQIVHASTTLGKIPVQDVRHDLDQVQNPPSQRWMYADPAVSANNPVEFTFNTPIGTPPASQCGRVLFSDFHVNTGGAGAGKFPNECGKASPLTPQEKALEFLLFDLTSCIQPDVPPPPMCTPLTCAAQGYTCGPAGDGCGNIIQCGPCVAGQICGGGGPNKCGSPCKPLSCGDQGFNCGPAGDGCGKQIDCGMCVMGKACGGGGLPGVCGTGKCAPENCAQQGLMCGPAGDGCGNVIQCGDCPEGQTCGGGGTPGVCGMPHCTPTTCAAMGANCGLIGDGCGGSLDCGKCMPPETCGGGGKANQCGSLG